MDRLTSDDSSAKVSFVGEMRESLEASSCASPRFLSLMKKSQYFSWEFMAKKEKLQLLEETDQTGLVCVSFSHLQPVSKNIFVHD